MMPRRAGGGRVAAVDHHPVEPVGTAIGEGSIELVVEQARLLLQRRIRPANVEPVRIIGREFEIIGEPDQRAERVDRDRCRRFNRVGERLHDHPATRITAHCPAVQTIVEILLDVCRIEDRHHHGLEDMLGLVGKGRRFCCVIVTGDHQDPAVLR
jgi:hypothetical protein